MKVYLGPYKSWIGPYQIAEKLMFWTNRHEDKRVHALGKWLATNKDGEDSWLMRACSAIDKKRKRKMIIKLDYYDTWSMDNTLSVIILPLLIQLKDTNHGAPFTDDEDVPEELRRTSAPPCDEWETDDNWFKRWNWIMDEMIFAFNHKANFEESNYYHHLPEDYDAPEGWSWVGGFGVMKGFWVDRATQKADSERVKNGLRLFGKYYEALWD